MAEAAASAEGAVSNVNDKLSTKLDTGVFEEFKSKAATKEELEERVGAAQSLILGKIELMPFSPTDLPKRWYHSNGDKYRKDSPQGKALLSLPESYRTAFKIVDTGDEVNVPNLYHTDGRGYFLRVSRMPGEVQGDAVRNVAGRVLRGLDGGPSGSFYVGNSPVGQGTRPLTWSSTGNTLSNIDFDLSRSVPTANENRPLNIGLTPAIYLGV